MTATSTGSAQTAATSPTPPAAPGATNATPTVSATSSPPACATTKTAYCPSSADVDGVGDYTLTQRGWETSMGLPPLVRAY